MAIRRPANHPTPQPPLTTSHRDVVGFWLLLLCAGACTGTDGPVTCTPTASTSCGTDPNPAPWPGSNDVTTADDAGVLGKNISGLVFDPAVPGALWAVRNSPGELFRLNSGAGVWTPDAAGGWLNGRALRYPDGSGDPDAEGVTITAAGVSGGVYVSAERNNLVGSVSRLSVLRYDVSQPGTVLRATHEWNLTPMIPSTDPNLGLEGITWVPDSMLTANGMVDEHTAQAYRPADYPSHGSGLFFVGVESTGALYAFALNHSANSAVRVSSSTSGLAEVMELEFDDLTGQMWAICDNGCGNRSVVLEIAQTAPDKGRFRVVRQFLRPSSLPDVNNEGFAIAPRSACSGGRRAVLWSDDDNSAGYALRRASLPCAPVR